MSLTGNNMSDTLEGNLLQWFQGTSFPAAPTNLFFGLFTTAPADAGTLASPQNGTEVSTTNGVLGFTNYARISVAAASAWTAIAAASGDSTGQQITNAAALGPGTAWLNNGGSTVPIVGVGIWDAATNGNLLAYFTFVSTNLPTGNGFQIAANQLILQVD